MCFFSCGDNQNTITLYWKKKVYIYSFHTLVPVTESLWIELAVLGTVLDLVDPQENTCRVAAVMHMKTDQ